MKKIIISKFEYEFLIASLEELYNISSDEIVTDKWMVKLEETRMLFDLELEFYNIRNDKQTPTKKEMIKWIISKLKAKSLDL
jgi:hypothetical protein